MVSANQARKKKAFEKQEAKKAGQSQETARSKARSTTQKKKERKGVRTLVGTGKTAVEVRGKEAASAEVAKQRAATAKAKPAKQMGKIELTPDMLKSEGAALQEAGIGQQQPTQPQQEQGLASKALQGIKEWFGGTPLGSAIMGTPQDVISPDDPLSILSALPIGGAFTKVGATAAKMVGKMSALQIMKYGGKEGAEKAIAKLLSKQTLKSTTDALVKQATNPLAGDVGKAAMGGVIFGRDTAGKLASSTVGWGKTIPPWIYPMTTKKASKTTKYLKILGLSTTAIGLIGGYLFSIPWSLNEKSDAATTLTINMRDASKAEDWESVAEYATLLDEVTDVNWVETLAPFYNVGAAVMDKFKAAKLVSKNLMEDMEISQAGGGEPSRFVQDTQAATDIKGEEFDRQRGIIEDYNTMKLERQQQADQEMQQFWQDYLEQKQAGEEEMREFWAEYQKNKQEFWKSYQENRTKSQLGFGLL